ncbi:MAG TPA: lactate utilization protein [Pirellulales bacterium]|jgi:L-lactate utilization protein LutC|nr:lactate utilization protein [Pirellulales bacterium]
MHKQEFLRRVRAAAETGRAYRVAPTAAVSPAAGYVGGGENLCARFAHEVNAVGGFAHHTHSEAELRGVLTRLLAERAARSALCWQHPLLERLDIAALLRQAAVEVCDYATLARQPPSEQRAKMLAADIGVTSATYAIAETGSLAMASQSGRERAASLFPPVHLAIVERSQILPDLFDLFQKLDADGSAAIATNLTLITGPSKTGDIELQLTTGVHGPGVWHVLIGDW